MMITLLIRSGDLLIFTENFYLIHSGQFINFDFFSMNRQTDRWTNRQTDLLIETPMLEFKNVFEF